MDEERELNDAADEPLSGASFLKEGERRSVTVLFADMKGFTALSERSDPEEMDALMTRVFSRFEAIVRKHGGYVEKYIGDAMVAVFGVPGLHEDDAARAIDSGLEFNGLTRRAGPDFPSGVQFRIGVHAGLVTTGRRGSFDVVTGHTLAVAARLQAAAPPNGILVSQSARELCDKLFIFSEAQELTLKGKEERVLAFQALARRKAMFDYATPFVDRKTPLETLTGEYVRHMRGAPRCVYISGDGGIGKTRLVAEFWARLKGFPDFRATFLAVNPSSFGNADYAALLHAVADFLDLRSDASYEEFEEAARSHIELDEAYLKDAYGLWKPGERPSGESRFVAALGALFDAILASDGDTYPDVVVLDNARLTDEKSLEFFRSYFASARARPFFVLCDRIADERAALVFGSTLSLALEPLSDEDSAALARALEPEGLDDDTLSLIVDRSQGYPLFIEEYVKLLRSSKDTGSLPESIQTTILAALDRLRPEDRSLAQQLSVFRFPFGLEAARALHARADGDPDTVAERLERLAAERIVAPAAEGSWAFKHAIVREAVYSSLLLHNRRVLHGIAAELLLPEGRPADIFYHLAAAEDWAQARSYLVRERPRLPLESAPLIVSLISHCPADRPGDLIELHFMHYATLFNNRVYEGLKDIIQDMYTLALGVRTRFYLARCYHLFMTSYYMGLDYRSAVIYGRKALDAYEGYQAEPNEVNARGRANARYFLSFCYLGLNDFDSAYEALEGMDRSLPFAAGLYANAMATYSRMKGDHAEAVLWNGRLIADAEGKHDEDELCKRRAIAVADALKDFRFQEAAAIENPDRLYSDFDAELAVGYYAALAVAYRLGGEGDASAKAFGTAEYHLAQARSDAERASCGANLSWARLLAGDRRSAGEAALAALAAANRCRHYAAVFSCELILAELALIEGRRDEFAFFLRDASMLVHAPLYRERAAMARFWYFAWILLESAEEGDSLGELLRWEDRDEYLAEARRLLDAELESLPDDEARERCVSLSVYGRIARG